MGFSPGVAALKWCLQAPGKVPLINEGRVSQGWLWSWFHEGGWLYGWWQNLVRNWNGWALQRIVFAVGGGWGRWYLMGRLCRYSLWGPQGAAVLGTDTSGWQVVVVHSGT